MNRAHGTHLVRRFFESVRPGGPSAFDDQWAHDRLPATTAGLWFQLSSADRRHCVAVARAVEASAPGPDAIPDWVWGAALLHDIGKAEAGMGTVGRVVASLIELAGAERLGDRFITKPGMLGRLARQLNYTDLGAELLEATGADERVVAWAREHHSPPDEWTVPEPWGQVLAEADRT